jgi:hypothetical protein
MSLWFCWQADALAATASDPLAPMRESIVRTFVSYEWKIGAIGAVFIILNGIVFEVKRRARKRYYNEDYLQSDAWKRKRAMVLRRDKWKCVFCGAKATDVHHTRYARQIGREPIEWLVSVCARCHALEHPDKQAA